MISLIQRIKEVKLLFKNVLTCLEGRIGLHQVRSVFYPCLVATFLQVALHICLQVGVLLQSRAEKNIFEIIAKFAAK